MKSGLTSAISAVLAIFVMILCITGTSDLIEWIGDLWLVFLIAMSIAFLVGLFACKLKLRCNVLFGGLIGLISGLTVLANAISNI